MVLADDLLDDADLVACIFPPVLPDIHQQPQQLRLEVVVGECYGLA